jgi:hypothetical protein
MDSKIDYLNYNKDELFDVLEHIDDTQYPENAVTVYSVLQNKFGITEQDINNRYQDNGALLSLLRLALFPVVGELGMSKQELEEKLLRISKLSSKVNG